MGTNGFREPFTQDVGSYISRDEIARIVWVATATQTCYIVADTLLPLIEDAFAEKDKRIADLEAQLETIRRDPTLVLATDVPSFKVYHSRASIKGCRCGWAKLGASHPEHVADVYEESVAARGAGSGVRR